MHRSFKIFAFLFTAAIGWAFLEDDPLSEITEKFKDYNRIFPQTKLHLSFHQPAYVPGDTAFFKAYLLTEDLLPVKGRQIVEMSLLNSEGIEVSHYSFRIENGMVGSQMAIPTELPSGIYQVVAYTNWMKNFSSELYFTTLFPISGENRGIYKSETPVSIKLFPEGGSFLVGLPTRVVAFATKDGLPAEANGRVVDNYGKEIIQFACDKTGLSSFDLTLDNKITYSVELLSDGQKTPIDVAEEGYTLKVEKDGELLKTNIGFQSKRGKDESIYVILTSRSQVRYASMIVAKSSETTSVLIPLRNIPEGIAQLTVFDGKANVMASRLIFVPSLVDTKVDLRLSAQSMSTRNTASFEVDIKDQYGASKGADVLISAYYGNLFPEVEAADFREDILVRDDIPNSQLFLQRIDMNTDQGLIALDNYLITQTWKRFNWEEVLSNKKTNPEYRAEGTLLFDGVATFTDTGKPVPDSTLVLLFLQKRTFGYEVYTTKDGAVRWPVYFDFYGDENIMYSMESKNKRLFNTNIKLLKDSLIGYKTPSYTWGNQKDPYYSFSTLANAVTSSFSYGWKKVEAVHTTANPNAAIEDELNGVDATINVEDYVVFPTIEDLFREVVRFVQNRKVGGKKTLRVLSSDSNNPIMGDPLYIVDGIATRNTDFIFSLKPGDIAIIKVINDARKLRNLGSITKNGVIFFQTKIADIRSLIPKDDILIVDGLVKSLAYENKILTKSTHTPHLKSSVFWKTQLDRNERGLIADTFYSADNTGTLNIKVQGITSDGIPFEKIKTVEVKFEPSN